LKGKPTPARRTRPGPAALHLSCASRAHGRSHGVSAPRRPTKEPRWMSPAA